MYRGIINLLRQGGTNAPPMPAGNAPPPAPLRNVVVAPSLPDAGGEEAPPPARRRRIDQYFIPEEMPIPERRELEDHKEKGSNFYMIPIQVDRWLRNQGFISPFGNLQLKPLRKWVDKQKKEKFHLEWDVRSDDNTYMENEMRRLLDMDERDVFYPTLQYIHKGETDKEERILTIPIQDVYDLPCVLMVYILLQLSTLANRTNSWEAVYTIEDGAQHIIQGDDNKPLRIYDGRISYDFVRKIYLTFFRELVPVFNNFLKKSDGTYRGEVSWVGSEGSGVRIILNRGLYEGKVHIHLFFICVKTQKQAGCWTQEVEDLLMASVGDSVISVRNEHDNKCLLYCIIMGLIVKIAPRGGRVFSGFMVKDSEIYSKGTYMYTGSDDVSCLIRRLCQVLLPAAYSEGAPDPLVKFVNDIDKKAGTMMSIDGFRKEFQEIEATLIPNNLCGIDVYGIDYNVNVHVYPLYISKNREKVIQLLCVTPKESLTSHYCLINNFDRLMQKSGGKQFFSCSKCGQCFYHRRLLFNHQCVEESDIKTDDDGYHYSWKNARESTDIVVGVCTKCRLMFVNDFELEYHKEHCFMNGKTGYRHVQLVSYAENDHPMLEGVAIDEDAERNHVKRRRVLYCDFESSIDPDTCLHTFMSYGLYDTKLHTYTKGYDIKDLFVYLDGLCSDPEDNIYVYFHNAMNYDANFVLRYVLATPPYKNWGIRVIMKSSNRLQKLVFYTNPQAGKRRKAIHIGDTCLFLTMSLEKIVDCKRSDNLATNIDRFPRFFTEFRKQYPWVKDEEIDMILKKNIFPYKFFTASSKLDTPVNEFLQLFEPKEENLGNFSERVTLEDLDKGYLQTSEIIRIFHIKSARDYHDLYLMCDVMQLADIFEHSMKILHETHRIHLTQYLGMPSASWAAFLRFDPNMRIPLYENTLFAEFFKGMTRGGVTSAALRYAKADANHSIIYLDVNGLYPYVMQKYLYPCGTFQFVQCNWSGKIICHTKLLELFAQFEREKRGMCFCVDMHFPDDVKFKTDMFPFAPEHRSIKEEFFTDFNNRKLTPFLERWSAANPAAKLQEFNGLVCTLYDKTKYNVHWRLLQFYIRHGVEVTKVHFGVSFNEGDYMAGYIRKNIEMRNNAATPFEKLVLKLMSNSVYGKTFESPFKRKKFLIVNDPSTLQGLIDEGNIAAMVPIDDLGWIVQMDGEDIVLDKPTYIGACVCEYAKLHMYELLYDKLMPMFAPRDSESFGCQLVYTDTDSFIVRVTHPEGVDCSSPEKLFAYMRSVDPTLLGGIGGQVKSETGEDETIAECIALRSKVYAYKTTGGHIGKRAKGTTYDAQEMQLDWEIYKKTLETLVSHDTHNLQFVRKTFKVSTIDALRQSLSVNDAKRYVCADGIHTHAYGYPDISSSDVVVPEDHSS